MLLRIPCGHDIPFFLSSPPSQLVMWEFKMVEMAECLPSLFSPPPSPLLTESTAGLLILCHGRARARVCSPQGRKGGGWFMCRVGEGKLWFSFPVRSREKRDRKRREKEKDKGEKNNPAVYPDCGLYVLWLVCMVLSPTCFLCCCGDTLCTFLSLPLWVC